MIKRLIFVSVAAMWLRFADGSAQVTVAVRAESDVAGAQIKLGEVAEITGKDAALIARLSLIEIGAAPISGQKRTMGLADVMARLRLNGVDPASLNLNCPLRFSIARAGAELFVADVQQVALKAVEDARKTIEGNATLEPGTVVFKWFIPPGKRELKVDTIKGSLDGPVINVPITVLVDGRPVKTIEFPVRVHKMTKMLVATRKLEPHVVIRAEDVSLTEMEVLSVSGELIVDPKAVIGLRTTRQIAMGAPITELCVEAEQVIKPGADLILEMVVGGVHVTLPAQARSSGSVGMRVRIFVTQTKKEMTAVVIDARKVRIEENGQ